MPNQSIGRYYQNQFGGFTITLPAVSVGATGDAVIAGLGNFGSKYIVRRITVTNASATVASGFLGVFTAAAAGGTAIAANQALTNVNSTTAFVDLTLAAGATGSFRTETQLYLNVGTAVAGQTVDVLIQIDIVRT